MHNFVVLCEYNEFFNNLKDLKSGARANRAVTQIDTCFLTLIF